MSLSSEVNRRNREYTMHYRKFYNCKPIKMLFENSNTKNISSSSESKITQIYTEIKVIKLKSKFVTISETEHAREVCSLQTDHNLVFRLVFISCLYVTSKSFEKVNLTPVRSSCRWHKFLWIYVAVALWEMTTRTAISKYMKRRFTFSNCEPRYARTIIWSK